MPQLAWRPAQSGKIGPGRRRPVALTLSRMDAQGGKLIPLSGAGKAAHSGAPSGSRDL